MRVSSALPTKKNLAGGRPYLRGKGSHLLPPLTLQYMLNPSWTPQSPPRTSGSLCHCVQDPMALKKINSPYRFQGEKTRRFAKPVRGLAPQRRLARGLPGPCPFMPECVHVFLLVIQDRRLLCTYYLPAVLVNCFVATVQISFGFQSLLGIFFDFT